MIPHRAAEAQVLGLERAGDARGDGVEGAGEEGGRAQVDLHVHLGGADHLHQVAKQPESGHVGARARPVPEQAVRAGAVRLLHHVERGGDPRTPRPAPHVRGEEGAGAQRLGEDEAVARTHPALAQDLPALDEPAHRKAQRELRALAGMPAHERGARLAQHLRRAGHHLRQRVLDLRLDAVREGGHGQRGLRLGPHREDVAQAVVRGDAAEEVGVVDHRPEGIDGVHQDLAGRRLHHRRVVGVGEPDEHVVARHRLDPVHHPREHRRVDLRPAPAAAHGDGRELPDRVVPGETAREIELRVVGHVGEVGEPAHEAPVDPVLPPPHPAALEHQRSAAGGHGALAAGADEAQVPALRDERPRREPA